MIETIFSIDGEETTTPETTETPEEGGEMGGGEMPAAPEGRLDGEEMGDGGSKEEENA